MNIEAVFKLGSIAFASNRAHSSISSSLPSSCAPAIRANATFGLSSITACLSLSPQKLFRASAQLIAKASVDLVQPCSTGNPNEVGRQIGKYAAKIPTGIVDDF